MRPLPVARRLFARLAAATAVAGLGACGPALAQPPAAAGADPAAAILAAHKKIDDEYGRARMSPFTAVAVQYFEPGQTHRLGVSAEAVAFDPAESMTDVIAISLEAGSFVMSPVAGTKPPVVLGKNAEGDVVVSPGTPLTARTTIGSRDVVGLGRYYVESFPRPDSGNVRVFDPDTPARHAFTGLKWFPPNLALQVKAVLEPIARPDMVVIATSRGLKKEYFRVGVFRFTIDGTPLALTALAVSADPKAGDELFVPFRDATTGIETYEVGRYLTLPFQRPGSPYVLDFNAATNPLCNYSPYYNCPIPPRENRLAVPIRAGEMTYPKVH
jgi:uncharacterized protein (DUF1684 family)